MLIDPNYDKTYGTLHAIYDKHWRKYRENIDSKQMCCMWPTDDPPDVLEDTEPLFDMEKMFDISIDEDAAIDSYFFVPFTLQFIFQYEQVCKSS